MRDLWSPSLATLAMVLAGSSVAVSGFLASYPVLEAQALRYAVSAAILLAVARRQRQIQLLALSWRDVLALVALGATGLAAFNVFVVLAVAEADPSAVGVIIGGAPILLALAGPLLSRAAPSLKLLLAAAIVTAGAALVEGVAGATTPKGMLLSCGALASEVAVLGAGGADSAADWTNRRLALRLHRRERSALSGGDGCWHSAAEFGGVRGHRISGSRHADRVCRLVREHRTNWRGPHWHLCRPDARGRLRYWRARRHRDVSPARAVGTLVVCAGIALGLATDHRSAIWGLVCQVHIRARKPENAA